MPSTEHARNDLNYFPNVEAIRAAAERIRPVAHKTPCAIHAAFSKKYGATIWFKREDLQPVRSYKVRGAFNKMADFNEDQRANGFVCASAGNHAQGFALACRYLKAEGAIFMPVTTPSQKIAQVRMFGQEYVDIKLVGDTFDDAKHAAYDYSRDNGADFIHPFEDEKVIEGQGTVGLEILDQVDGKVDYVIAPIGGGGLASGLIGVFSALSPDTRIIGVEPEGAAAMATSIKNGANTTLTRIDPFVDGAAVKRVGDLNFNICAPHLQDVVLVHEGHACRTILELYNKDAIVVEPAGALSVAALAKLGNSIKGKNVVCIISGSNNDITRTEEIKERALLYEGLKHYFIVRFPQRSGALKEFVAEILGPHDDITHFEYTKKNSRERGSAVVGVELKSAGDFDSLVSRMKEHGFFGEYLNDNDVLMDMLV